jgi:hypothetical protein
MQRLFRYMGFVDDSMPSQRPWVTRISPPRFASSQRDRWCSAILWMFLIGSAVALIIHGPWIWYVIGGIDILIAVPALVNTLLWTIQRRPTS